MAVPNTNIMAVNDLHGDGVAFVRAEGLALSPDHRRTGINSALAAIEEALSLPRAA